MTPNMRPPYVEPDDQVLSEPVWCFHPDRARINPDTPWFCVTCGEQAWTGEDNATEEVRALAEPGGETGDRGAPLEAPHVAKKEDKRESFLDFLFGGRA